MNKLTDEQLRTVVSELSELMPDLKAIVKGRREQEIFNRRAAQIGRWVVIIAGGVATVIGTIWAVSKLIFTLGSNQ